MRIKQLDILRALAIALVFGRHFDILAPWHRGGWAGVDLFFVLSGFLISGLLFGDFKRLGRIRAGRFLIRRAFKIYPSFYVFMGWTVVMFLFHRGHLRIPCLLTELFFFQSYGPWMWAHTWSLAVEEHFYLTLPFLLILLCRVSRNPRDPFRAVHWIFLCAALASLILRLWLTRNGSVSLLVVQFPTHLNLDSLLFGVLLSYLHHFRRPVFDRIAAIPGWILLTGAVLLAAPAFIWQIEATPFIETFGHPMLYLGSGALLLFALGRPIVPSANPVVRSLGDALAFVGRHSYSIYIWHYPMSDWGLEFLRRLRVLPQAPIWQFLIYASASLAIGIAMARLVEIPALRLRDRLFPALGSARSGNRSAASAVLVPEAANPA